MKSRTTFRSFVVLVILCAALMPLNVLAGDEDGVAGYKFKIYDADGDGIDGNEVNAGFGGASLAGSDIDHTSQDARVYSSLVAQYVKWAVIWWLK